MLLADPYKAVEVFPRTDCGARADDYGIEYNRLLHMLKGLVEWLAPFCKLLSSA